MGGGINFQKDLIFIDIKKKTSSEVITFLSKKLNESGYVENSFLQAILSREAMHPTGLPLSRIGVAIPHTDTEHVKKPIMSVAILKEPVQFQMMGNVDESVMAKIVFMLAIKDPTKQIVLLENLMTMFQDEYLMSLVENAKSSEEVLTVLQQVFINV